MSKIHLDRLRRRTGYKNERLAELVGRILATNRENIENRMARKTSAEWSKEWEKYAGRGAKRIAIPQPDDIVQGRAIHALKSAKDGRLITDTLRDRITADLRATLDRARRAGKPLFTEASHDRPKGTLRPAAVKEFERSIQETFSAYTRRDPSLGMPPNVHAIAVTEVRSATNLVKHRFATELSRQNPGKIVLKRWVHNRSMSKDPRPGHLRMNGVTVPMENQFRVPRYRRVRGRWVLEGHDMMAHPHAEGAPAEQVITCNCEVQYVLRER